MPDFQGELIRNLKRLAKGAPDVFAKAQMEETKIEARECAAVTPVDKGTLKKSVRAVGPQRDGRTVKTAVVAGEDGSGAEAYALTVHEDLDAFHLNGGQAKYIEGPLNQSAGSIGARIAKRCDLSKVF